jgi:hypothetical protein
MIMGMAGSIHGLIVVSCVAFLVLVFGFAFMIPLLLFPVLLWVMIASRYFSKFIHIILLTSTARAY